MSVMRRMAVFLSACTMLAAAQIARADDYPNRNVRLIVPFPPGGSVDYVARIVGQKFSEYLGQPVIIDNKGGASGSIGAMEASKAKPDGYTLLMVFDSHAVNHHLYKKLQYDTFKSFDYITLMVTSPMLLATAKSFAPNTVPEMISYAKGRQVELTYGSAGTGSSNHLNALAFSDRAGIGSTHVPYKGGGPMLTAVLSGEVDFVITTMPVILSQVKAGRVKALAIGSKTRVPQLPDTPAISEYLPGYEATSWIGLAGPAGLPQEVRIKIRNAMVKALDAPEVKNKLSSDGFQIIASTPEAFTAKVQSESDTLGKLIDKRQVKVE
jgi:tripartite-type tricarboxylate transporter receptor subunit TctC